MQKRLIVGTNNAHKAEEIGQMLAELGVEVVTPRMLGYEGEPVEDGDTFESNALIKARYYAHKSGLPCLADDSGLVVDALDGRPGIYSSRYAENDAARHTKLLGELAGLSPQERTARFVCVAALVLPDAVGDGPIAGEGECLERGTCEGQIADAPRGTNGFGYDPVFFQEDLGCTLAEISAEDKNARSHRGAAMKNMLPHLIALFR